MKLLGKIFIGLNFVSLLSYAQTPNDQEENVELFKEKLQQYFDKHDYNSREQMVIKVPKKSDNMPTGNFRSFMVDEKLGLAYEFATQKIYDENSTLVYLIEKEKIYDMQADTYYDFR